MRYTRGSAVEPFMLSPTVLGVSVPVIGFVLLTAVGSELRAGDLRTVWRRPRVVVAGLVVPPLVLPAVAMALNAWLAPPPAIASGLLLIAICPVGGISNTFTYLARGSTALSITLTTLSCLMGVVTVPAIGTLIGRVTGGPPAAHLPLEVLLGQLLATVVIPVSLGIVLRQRWPRFADDYQPGMQRAGFGLLALLLVMIVLADVRSFVSALSDAVPLAGAFVACAAAVGGGCGHVLGCDLRERVTLAIEFATRNVAVATILAVTAGRIEFATFATTYFLTELSLMTAAAIAFRRVVARSRAVAARIAR